MVNFGCIETMLNIGFEKLGRFVSTHPVKIIVISILSTICLSAGIFKLQIANDVFYLVAPKDSRAYEEEKVIGELFPLNKSTEYDFLRDKNLGVFTVAIVQPKNGKSAFERTVLDEVIALDRTIRSFEIRYQGKVFTYGRICARNNGKCFNNSVVKLLQEMQKNKVVSIKYPFDVNFTSMKFEITGTAFGDVTVNSKREIIEAKAFRLLYFLDDSDKEKEEVAKKWSKEFLRVMLSRKPNTANAYAFSMENLSEEFWQLAVTAMKYGTIVTVLLIILCVVFTSTSDWVTSKPLLGIGGCISVGLAVIASTSAISIIGIPITPFNSTVPFLAAGIGVDDMFILLAAWRREKEAKNVVERMGKAYRNAAMSVTMTSLTNIIAFSIGALVTVPMVHCFCIQSVFVIAFDFLYQLTFFGACMALDGYREEKKLHPITFKPVPLSKDAGKRSAIYRIPFTNRSEISENITPKMMLWFRDSFGVWISQPRTRVFISMVFAIYLAGAGWSFTTLEEGTQTEHFYSYDSEAYKFFQVDKRFERGSFHVQVVITENLDYSQRKVQKYVTKTVDDIQRSKYVSPYAFNWLKQYLLFIGYYSKHNAYNLSDPVEFNRCLRDEFFHHPMGKVYRKDVVFNEDGIHISASRFIVFLRNFSDTAKRKEAITEIRMIADSQHYPVTVQCAWWRLFELSLILQKLTVQSILGAIAAMFVVFLISINNLANVVCVTISLASIQFGVLGYMANFGITISISSFLIIIVSVGLCFDSSAHVISSYNIDAQSLEERNRHTFYSVGWPIIQGSVTTLLMATPIVIVPNKCFREFAILVYMEIIISTLHALFVLPTILSHWDVAKRFFSGCRKSMRDENVGKLPSTNVIECSHM